MQIFWRLNQCELAGDGIALNQLALARNGGGLYVYNQAWAGWCLQAISCMLHYHSTQRNSRPVCACVCVCMWDVRQHRTQPAGTESSLQEASRCQVPPPLRLRWEGCTTGVCWLPGSPWKAHPINTQSTLINLLSLFSNETNSWQQIYDHICKKKVKECIAVYGNPSHSYGVSLAVRDHTVLPVTWHKQTHPAFTPAIHANVFYASYATDA